jgi:hypothetical protein
VRHLRHPYFNLQQSTSGTLSYAVALGKAVVSTPYLHAKELLAGDAGRLIEPDSAPAIAEAVIALLDDPSAARAAAARLCEGPADDLAALRRRRRGADRGGGGAGGARRAADRDAGLTAVLAMSDGTGMLQHAIGAVPDRRHGYCLDDNARALMLTNLAAG